MKLEVLEKDFYYHIYNRGINREIIFKSDDNKRYFLRLLLKYLSSKISVFAYCLMDNHYHLIIRIDNDVEEVIQSFSNLFNSLTEESSNSSLPVMKLRTITNLLFMNSMKISSKLVGLKLNSLLLYIML